MTRSTRSNFPFEILAKNITLSLETDRDRGHSYFPEMGDTLVYFATLYCLEKTLRDLVYYELRGIHGVEWEQKISGLDFYKDAKRRKNQFKEAALDTAEKMDTLDFLTLGELIFVITHSSAWPHFKKIFSNKEAFAECAKKLLDIRNSIAHGRNVSHENTLELKTQMAKFHKFFNNFRRLEKESATEAEDFTRYDNMLTCTPINLRHHILLRLCTTKGWYLDFDKLSSENMDRLDRHITFATEEKTVSFMDFQAGSGQTVWLLIPSKCPPESMQDISTQLGTCLSKKINYINLKCYRDICSLFFAHINGLDNYISKGFFWPFESASFGLDGE